MLYSALYVGATGVLASSRELEVIGNNVANVNTIGFKPSVVSFQDLIYTGREDGLAAAGLPYPTGEQLGEGVDVQSVTPVFTQGVLNPAGRATDLAIDGLGFFAVTLPDGTTGYTRAGDFNVDAAGRLVTADGFPVAGGVVLPPGTTGVQVAADGTVTALTAAGTVVAGQITLATFSNPSGLLQIGNTTFAAGPASGPPTVGTPGTLGLGTIAQQALEQSTVDLARELTNLIVAQQAFRFNTQAVAVANATLGATVDVIA